MGRKRGRITVQSQPTGATRAMQRLMGVVHAVFGFAFVVIGITEILPNTGLFALPFIVIGAFFTINGIRLAVSKNDVAHRVGYDVETDLDRSIVGIMEDVEDGSFSPSDPDHNHISSIGPDPQKRLEQLERLKESGLISKEEYDQKRKEILAQL